ncbi:MAG: hypothetical protein LBQ47_02815 [Endomicrobium sp.]|jgi:hypothetical protein|nr:hypothetical protein [Endomicrobium sp.]
MADYLTLICQIIKRELNLDDGQIWIYNIKRFIPEDKRVYVEVSDNASDKIISNQKHYEDDGNGGINVIQALITQTSISVDVCSYGEDARTARDHIIMALNSEYSIETQEANGFHIAPHSVTVNALDEIDGAKILYRFNISFNIHRSAETTKKTKDFIKGRIGIKVDPKGSAETDI